MIVVVLLAGHGIRAVVRKLSIKPIVQCSYELLVCRLVGQFGPSSDLPVLNFDLLRLGCLELGQAGHGRTVDVGGAREITFEELRLDGMQMLANQCSLLPCLQHPGRENVRRAKVRRKVTSLRLAQQLTGCSGPFE
jgi:hypothetical protein